LKNKGNEIFEFDQGLPENDLIKFINSCDFIIHLAGINRPIDPSEFLNGNVNFTKKLIDLVELTNSKAPIIFSSSTQALLDNPYGRSKKMAEDQLFEFAQKGHKVYIFRLYNVFGKWCKPNYNSVIATWCYDISHNIPIFVNKDHCKVDFVYIDDVCSEFEKIMLGKQIIFQKIYYVEPHYKVDITKLSVLLNSFKESRNRNILVKQNGFSKKLYATFLSYFEPSDLSIQLFSHSDDRGSFTEILKTLNYGQFSVNLVHPGITKGNHFHMTKCEKYIVIDGECEIRLQKLGDTQITSYRCSGQQLFSIDIPPGFVHSITNVGQKDSFVLIWASENYDSTNSDTFPLCMGS
jgi:UDP-2-acetamido-2,6-beta-L-arabino-hexul-4-ose reductase